MLWKNGLRDKDEMDPYSSLPIQAQQQPLNPTVLDSLARSNPALIEKYRQQMEEKNAAIDTAKSQQTMGDYANVAGNLMNDFNNSQKQDVILKNKFANLGNTPKINAAERPAYQDRISGITGRNLQQAQADRTRIDSDFKNGVALNDFQANTDPNSLESEQARNYLKKIVPSAAKYPGIDKMSAAQIDKVAPGIYKAYADELNRKNEMAKITKSGENDSKKYTHQLNKDYNSDATTSDTREIMQAAAKAEALARDNTGKSDIALVYAFAKAIDPRSVVKEAEYKVYSTNGSLVGQVDSYIQRAKNGKLPDSERAEILRTIRTTANAQKEKQIAVDNRYRMQAEFYGVDPKYIFNEAVPDKPAPNTIVEVAGKKYKVAADGDTLEEIGTQLPGNIQDVISGKAVK